MATTLGPWLCILMSDPDSTHSATPSLQDCGLFRAALEHSRDAILITGIDLDGENSPTIEYANSAYGRLTGHAPEAAIGTRAPFMEGEGANAAAIRKALESHGAWSGELIHRTSIGTTFRGEWMIRVHSDDAAEQRHLIAVLRDVTARHFQQEQLALAETAFEHMHEGLMLTDPNDVILRVNPAFTRITGYAPHEVIGKTPSILSSGLHAPDFHQSMRQALKSEHHWQGEVWNRRKDGNVYPQWLTINAALDEHDQPIYYLAVFTDIGERHRAREVIREHEEWARVMLNTTVDGIITTDEAGLIETFNRAAVDLFGYHTKEILHQPATMLFADLDRDEDAATLMERLHAAGHDGGAEIEARSRAGKTFPAYIAVSDFQFGGRQRYTAIIRDITRDKEREAELAWQAARDPLTGLCNRREFERRMATLLKEPTDPDGSRHTLLYVDLDQFKLVNDTCGHSAGDELLRELSAWLSRDLQEGDLLARLGGDEFGLLIRNDDMDHALEVAQSLIDRIRTFRFQWGARTFSIGASIGVAPITPGADDMSSLLQAADHACYEAKDRGRNRIQVYDAASSTFERRHAELEWASILPQALEEERFELYYQPIHSLNGSGGGPHGEILLRLRDHEGNQVSPGLFIPAGERYNIMPAVDRWVVETVFDGIARMLRAEPARRDSVTSINISGNSLNDPEFLPFVRRCFEKYHIPPSCICLEITETSAVSDLEQTRELLLNARRLGCRTALDDFGTGMSSFGYLRELPVDYLKIDGSFVRDMDADEVHHAMVQAIQRVGQVMRIHTVAEFVENEQVRESLCRMGVDYGQGFHLDRPQPWPWSSPAA